MCLAMCAKMMLITPASLLLPLRTLIDGQKARRMERVEAPQPESAARLELVQANCAVLHAGASSLRSTRGLRIEALCRWADKDGFAPSEASMRGAAPLAGQAVLEFRH